MGASSRCMDRTLSKLRGNRKGDAPERVFLQPFNEGVDELLVHALVELTAA